MSRKDYRSIAAIVKEHSGCEFRADLAQRLSMVFKIDNPMFDRERFFAACGETPDSAKRQANLWAAKI